MLCMSRNHICKIHSSTWRSFSLATPLLFAKLILCIHDGWRMKIRKLGISSWRYPDEFVRNWLPWVAGRFMIVDPVATICRRDLHAHQKNSFERCVDRTVIKIPFPTSLYENTFKHLLYAMVHIDAFDILLGRGWIANTQGSQSRENRYNAQCFLCRTQLQDKWYDGLSERNFRAVVRNERRAMQVRQAEKAQYKHYMFAKWPLWSITALAVIQLLLSICTISRRKGCKNTYANKGILIFLLPIKRFRVLANTIQNFP